MANLRDLSEDSTRIYSEEFIAIDTIGVRMTTHGIPANFHCSPGVQDGTGEVSRTVVGLLDRTLQAHLDWATFFI